MVSSKALQIPRINFFGDTPATVDADSGATGTTMLSSGFDVSSPTLAGDGGTKASATASPLLNSAYTQHLDLGGRHAVERKASGCYSIQTLPAAPAS